MKFIQSLGGERIAVKSISSIHAFRPDKGHLFYTVRFNEGRDFAWIRPEETAEFFASKEYQS